MSLLFCDGFDHYDSDHITRKWDYREEFPFGSVNIVAGGGRFGSACLEMSDSWRKVIRAFPKGPVTFMTAGVAFMPVNGLTSAPAQIITLVSGGSFLCGVAASQTLQLYAFSGSSLTPIAYGSRPLRSRVYNYIELQVNGISGGGGAIKVWLNEQLVIDVTGVNTSGSSGYGAAEAFMLGGHTTWQRTGFPDGIRFDDFYVTDAAGSYCTGNLGDVRIIEQLPTSDVDKEWDPIGGGTDHYALVDDAYDGIDDDATRIQTATVGEKDTFGFPDLPTAQGQVHAVVLNLYGGKADSGSRAFKATAKLGGTYGDGDEQRVGADYVVYQSPMYRDPNGAAWTIDNVNAAKIGPKVTT